MKFLKELCENTKFVVQNFKLQFIAQISIQFPGIPALYCDAYSIKSSDLHPEFDRIRLFVVTNKLACVEYGNCLCVFEIKEAGKEGEANVHGDKELVLEIEKILIQSYLREV